MAGVVFDLGDPARAIQLQSQAAVLLDQLVAADPGNATLRQFLYESHYWLGFYLEKTGKPARALVEYRRALAGHRQLAAADSRNALAARYVGLAEEGVGTSMAALGHFADAIGHLRQALTILQTVAAADPADTYHKLPDLARAYSAIGDVYAHFPATGFRQRRQARLWYARSLSAWSLVRRQGAISHSDAPEPERIARELARLEQ